MDRGGGGVCRQKRDQGNENPGVKSKPAAAVKGDSFVGADAVEEWSHRTSPKRRMLHKKRDETRRRMLGTIISCPQFACAS
jgi:hypothetical protein